MVSSFGHRTLGAVVLDALANALVDDIEVIASPTEVHFRQGAAALSLRPLVIVSTDGAPKVIAVGERVPVTQPVVEVELFNPHSVGAQPGLRTECLQAFFRHAFSKLAKRGTIIRPRVIVSVTQDLSTILCGYEPSIFRSALIDAGARECVVRAA